MHFPMVSKEVGGEREWGGGKHSGIYINDTFGMVYLLSVPLVI